MNLSCLLRGTILIAVCVLFGSTTSQGAVTAKAVQVDGQVGWGASQRGPWRELKKDEQLAVKSYLRTGEGAKAVLQFPGGGVVTIHEYSVVYLAGMEAAGEESKSLVGLLVGKLWAKFTKTEKSNFTIYTPAAIAAARGTEWYVESDAQTRNATIGVWDGVVRVTPFDERLREQNQTDVKAGFQIQVVFNQPPDPTKVLKMEAARERERQQFNQQLDGLGLTSVLGGGAVEMAKIDEQRVDDVRQELRGAIAQERATKKMDEDYDKLQSAIARLYRDTEYLPGKGARKSSGKETLLCLVENKDHEGKPLNGWKGPYIDSNFLDPYGKEYTVYQWEVGGRLRGFYLHSNGPDKVASSHDDHERLITMGRLSRLVEELE